MLVCLNCNKKNILGSQYCVGCGSDLHDRRLAQVASKYNQLISDGYQLLHQGREDEAFLLGQVCLKADPFCKHGWSLLGDCHERKGDYLQALSCYQKAVERDPDSSLERLKIAYFQQKFFPPKPQKDRPKLEITPSRRLALSLGTLVAVCTGLVGILLVIGRTVQQTQPTLATSNPSENSTAFSSATYMPPTTDSRTSGSDRSNAQTQLAAAGLPINSLPPAYNPYQQGSLNSRPNQEDSSDFVNPRNRDEGQLSFDNEIPPLQPSQDQVKNLAPVDKQSTENILNPEPETSIEKQSESVVEIKLSGS